MINLKITEIYILLELRSDTKLYNEICKSLEVYICEDTVNKQLKYLLKKGLIRKNLWYSITENGVKLLNDYIKKVNDV